MRRYKLILVTLAGLGLLAILLEAFTDAPKDWWILLTEACPLVIVIYGISSACPDCEEWWAGNTISTEETGREQLSRQETKYDHAYKTDEPGNSNYHQTIERNETVYFIRTHLEHLMECKHCGHKWTTNSYRDSN